MLIVMSFVRPSRHICHRLGDRNRLLATTHVSSPQDDHIDKGTISQQCFPLRRAGSPLNKFLELNRRGKEGVFVLYEYELKTGERHRQR